MPDCYKVGPRKSEWFAPFLVNRLLRSLPWCFFNPSLALSTAATWPKNIVLRELINGRSADCGHVRPPLFNGITSVNIDTMDTDYVTDTRGGVGRVRRARSSGMAIGELGGCTHPWHRISHARPARYSLRR